MKFMENEIKVDLSAHTIEKKNKKTKNMFQLIETTKRSSFKIFDFKCIQEYISQNEYRVKRSYE